MGNNGRIVVAFGVAILVAGLVLGFAPVHRAGVSCGSAFRGTGKAADVADLRNAMEGFGGGSSISDACDATRSDRTTYAWMLLAPGALLLFVGGAYAAAGLVAKP